MSNSTLGGLIKDYRIQKGISQLDIAFSLGWKEPSRLSRIEQGRTEKPTREVLDKIIKAIGLKEEEKNVLLLTGGYLPTEEEITNIRKETQNILNTWEYPAVVLDFSWRSIDHNKQAAHLYSVTKEQEKMINKHKPRVLELLFSQKILQKNSVEEKVANEWHQFLKTVVLNFKYEQRNRTREKWYIEHVKELMKSELFRELWIETNVQHRLRGVVGKFAKKSIVQPEDSKKMLHFSLFVVPVLIDPRFEVEFLIPRDLETYKYYKSR